MQRISANYPKQTTTMGITKNFKNGDKVHYIPFEGAPESQMENGMVKRVHPTQQAAWVVYHCADDWANFMDYTGALTDYTDLEAGWVGEEVEHD